MINKKFKIQNILEDAAYVYLKANNFPKAADLYEKVAKTHNPVPLELLLKLGYCYLQIEDFPKSAKYYNTAVISHSTSLSEDYLANAYLAHSKAGLMTRCAEIYDLYLAKRQEKHGHLTSDLLKFGFGLNLQTSNFRRAMQLSDQFFQVCEIENTHVEIEDVENAANLHYQEKNFQRAVQLYEILIQRYNDAGKPVSEAMLEKFREASICAKNFPNTF